MDAALLWESVLTDIQLETNTPSIKILLSQTSILKRENNHIVIGCRQPFLITMIEKRYAPLIKTALDKRLNLDTTISFVGMEQKDASVNPPEPLFSLNSTQPQPPAPALQPTPIVMLNPDYTFETFAVSSSNQMAYAAATAVAKHPGVTYNPLFLYGGVGVGKTHLMHGIAHEMAHHKPQTKIIACTGEEFTNEIIEAISRKTTAAFKRKYRKVNIILIDDIQFIAGKYGVQEEFFHTFNAIQQSKGQIVLTSDRPPEDIEKLEARLKSRFEGGLTIDIAPPDFELKTAILLIKSKQRSFNLPIESAKLIAANVDNIRKLEGVLVRLMSESVIHQTTIDESLVRKVLGKNAAETVNADKEVPIRKILEVVSSYYRISQTQLKSEKRDRQFSLPRQIVYYLLNVEMKVPLVEIGSLMGGRDHTTILHGVRKITNLMASEEQIRVDVMGIKQKING